MPECYCSSPVVSAIPLRDCIYGGNHSAAKGNQEKKSLSHVGSLRSRAPASPPMCTSEHGQGQLDQALCRWLRHGSSILRESRGLDMGADCVHADLNRKCYRVRPI